MTIDSVASLGHPSTMTEHLMARAERTPDKLAFTFVYSGASSRSLTYGELDRQARAIARRLEDDKLSGSPILIGTPAGLSFVTAMFGCFYARCVAVPIALPRLGEPGEAERARLMAIVRSFRAGAFLTTGAIVPFLEASRGVLGLGDLPPLIAVDEIDPSEGDDYRITRPKDREIAVLQFTSGSTRRPRGVVIRHDNIVSNLSMQSRAYQSTSNDRIGGWLPHFHDMGLFGLIMHPVFVGAPAYLSSPIAFMRDPMSWLRMIHGYRLTVSGAPNFAYAMTARRAKEREIDPLDLSSWRLAFDGSEPIRRDGHRAFAARFERVGFAPSAFHPSYGLAEATLFVTGARADELPRSRQLERDSLALGRAVDAKLDEDSVEVASSGRAVSPGSVRIVHPDTFVEMPDDWVGEIWVQGPHIGGGYLDGGIRSRETFRAQLEGGDGTPFLRTGDLGFVHDGELYVTGRLKDLIVIRGRNFHPPDLEETIAERLGISEREIVVIETTLPRAGVDVIVRRPLTVELTEQIRQALFAGHSVAALRIVSVSHIPRTSSGKKQRRLLARALAEGRIGSSSRAAGGSSPRDGSPLASNTLASMGGEP